MYTLNTNTLLAQSTGGEKMLPKLPLIAVILIRCWHFTVDIKQSQASVIKTDSCSAVFT